MLTFFVISIIVLLVWTLWGNFSSRVEQTEYTVLKVADGYEIRNYPSHIVAQTVVPGPYRQALTEGFRIIASYIFGGNTRAEKIAMTAPVVEQKSRGESIAMTAPVMATLEGSSHVIAFTMPRAYTLETLPTPRDTRVKLTVVPAKKMATKEFSLYRTDSRLEAEKQELMSLLAKDNITPVGEPQYAGYSAPWTPPWLMRNEILVEIL